MHSALKMKNNANKNNVWARVSPGDLHFFELLEHCALYDSWKPTLILYYTQKEKKYLTKHEPMQ